MADGKRMLELQRESTGHPTAEEEAYIKSLWDKATMEQRLFVSLELFTDYDATALSTVIFTILSPSGLDIALWGNDVNFKKLEREVKKPVYRWILEELYVKEGREYARRSKSLSKWLWAHASN